jgi:RND family efflux transporter MFP subunit
MTLARNARSLAAAAALVAGIAGCSGGGAPAAAPGAAASGGRAPVVVSVEPARRESVQRSVALVGTLFGEEEAAISNKIPGRIRTIAADVGDVVTGGALLAELELEDFTLAEKAAERALEAVLARLGIAAVPDEHFDPDGVATVERAIAERENAKAKLARYFDLQRKDPGFVSKQVLDDSETAVAVAGANVDVERLAARALVAEAHQRQAELDIARRRLVDAHLIAPLGPRRWSVAARMASEGEYVKEGTPMFRLVACDVLKLRAAAPERYSPDFKIGQDAKVHVEAFERGFPGKVSRINPSVDLASRTFGVEVLVPNGSGDLRPGSFARADIFTRREEALLVPLDALVSFAGITKVFVESDGTAHERQITPGERHGAAIEVRGPVEAGARVVVRGQTVLADGTPVRVASPEAPAAAAAAPTGAAEVAR